ncbi:DNA repair protein RadC [Endozoicomonas sp. 4G]|uniref:RadC family protein n=1 Tax=Endozoicomonas sp. 4G TaxID=2872754 RepID=UPI002078B29E|nr:DNA repair protein RadC [Endozoicomonas sp. 4G]
MTHHPQGTAIKALPEEERPREKLIARGPAVLSDAELLAILLRTGYKGTHVLALASQLIERFQSLDGLLCATPTQLQALKGLGKAKAAELSAILEICQRVLSEKMSEQSTINSPDATRRYLQLHFRGCHREEFACLFLDTRHRVLALETLFQGTLDAAPVYPREVVKRALELNAAAVIASHNHPSGDPQPSQADIRITDTLKKALALMDIRLLDHIIIGKGVSVSLAEQGLM